MGNHSIDCEFCGQDQRSVGTDCCAEYTASEERRRALAIARREEEEAYLAKFGLKMTSWHAGYISTSDLIPFLKKHEGAILGDRFNREDPI